MRKLVIIPTYNEIENIQNLLPQLMALNESFDVLVVDDSSPDQTAEFVKTFAASEPQAAVPAIPAADAAAWRPTTATLDPVYPSMAPES